MSLSGTAPCTVSRKQRGLLTESKKRSSSWESRTQAQVQVNQLLCTELQGLMCLKTRESR